MKTTEEKTTEKNDDFILNEFNLGLKASADNKNNKVIEKGRTITTLNSSWLYSKCHTCKHTFRLDDIVLITETDEILHHGGVLQCSNHSISLNEINQVNLIDFYNGIIENYPPPQNLQIRILGSIEPNDIDINSFLSPPEFGFGRYKCTICGHTLRQGDIIVLCPCSPNSPKCKVAIHWDPFRGLNCWSEWNSFKNQLYCPVTSEIINNG